MFQLNQSQCKPYACKQVKEFQRKPYCPPLKPYTRNPAGATSGNQLKATDVLHLFPDEMLKHALSNSCASRESPLYHFVGLFEIAKGYICFNERIDECIRKDYNTLMRSMDFYLELVKATYGNDL